MTSVSLTVFWAALGGLLLLSWRLLRNHILPSSLDNIPGPPSRSLLKGEYIGSDYYILGRLILIFFSMTGSMLELQSRNAWPFFDRLTNDYGHVVKCTGMFGVSKKIEGCNQSMR